MLLLWPSVYWHMFAVEGCIQHSVLQWESWVPKEWRAQPSMPCLGLGKPRYWIIHDDLNWCTGGTETPKDVKRVLFGAISDSFKKNKGKKINQTNQRTKQKGDYPIIPVIKNLTIQIGRVKSLILSMKADYSLLQNITKHWNLESTLSFDWATTLNQLGM